MNIFTIAATATVIAAGFVNVAPAIAQPVSTSIRVAYADLNLSSPAGQQMLERRINAAASSVCEVNANQRDLRMKANSDHCYNAAVSGARTAIASATSPVYASR